MISARDLFAVLLFSVGVGLLVYASVFAYAAVAHWRWSRRLRRRIGHYS